MRRTMKFWMVLLGCVAASGPVPAWAGENEMMDILIQKLVKKGVLTQEDAREIKQEVEEEVKSTAKEMKGGAWLDKVKWGGDLRLRHETQRREPAVDRNRERFRLRFGFVANPTDPLEVGVRLATGASGDPVSTNQSFTGTFDKKAIFIDQAYGKYTPWKGGSGPLSTFSVIGGKMKNPFVTLPEGIVWDDDVTPEGVAMQWTAIDSLPILSGFLPTKPFINAGGFAITELSGDHGDPGVFGYQLGADVELPWKLQFQPAMSYCNFTGVKGINAANVTNSPAGNTTVIKGTATYLASDYNLVSVQGKLGIPNLAGQPVALLAEYTHNEDSNVSDPDDVNVDDDGAYTAGVQVGKVTEKFGSWQAYYFRKRVESDSAFGALTDSDFGGGGTNHKGHILGLSMGLNKWASIGAKYYRTDEIGGPQNRFDTFQADLNLKY